MRPEQLSEHYPRLYHMAWPYSWPSIQKHGLLSTRSLVELYKLDPQKGREILGQHRPSWVQISCEGLEIATIRDQKPMNDKGVRRALGDKNPNLWYELLNSMVFLWPTMERLKTMMRAKSYTGMSHDLLVIDTAKLVKRHCNEIRLSPINSGATKPFPHHRDLDLFKSFEEFPFDERKNKYTTAKAVAEVCVVCGIRDIKDLVIDVSTVTVNELDEIEI